MKKLSLLMLFVCLTAFLFCVGCSSDKQAPDDSLDSTFDSANVMDSDSVALANGSMGGHSVEAFVANFIQKNPDVFNNEVAMENYAKELKVAMDSVIDKDKHFAMGVAYTYDKLLETTAGAEEHYTVCFKAGKTGEGVQVDGTPGYKVCYSVVGDVDKEQMMKLKKGEEYRISGEVTSCADGSGDSPFGISDDNGFRIDLGRFIVRGLSAEKVE